MFDLGLQPLANDFRKPLEEREGFAPLKVLLCSRCSLGQLSVTVSPDTLYRNYKYVTSTSSTMERHFERLCADITQECGLGTLLEIGSNDGLFLKFAHAHGFRPCIGIDPALNLANSDTIQGPFNAHTSELAKERVGRIDVVLARHCFCHIADWRDMVQNLTTICHSDTLICIEVPYVGDMLDNTEFDTIYHEHLSYLSIQSVHALLKDSPFHLHRVLRYDIHGGCILLMIRHNDNWRKGAPPVELSDVSAHKWERFAVESDSRVEGLRNFVRNARKDLKTVAGFGASAKSTVWLNACGFTSQDICFVTDNTPHKPGNCSPGTNIPILPQEALLEFQPDYSILFAWNYTDEILKRNQQFRDRGGRFVVPIPTLQVL